MIKEDNIKHCICEKSISICNIDGKQNFICINCNKYCIISDEESIVTKISNTSQDTKKTINSNTSIQIASIDSLIDIKLIDLNKKYNIKCLLSLISFFIFIITSFIMYIINQ